MYSGSEELATVDSFDWTVFDLDYRQNGGLQEKFTMDVSQATSYSVSSNSEIKMWCEEEGPASAIKDGTFSYDYIDYGDNNEKKTRTGPHYAPPSCAEGVRTVFHSRYEGRTQDNPTDPKSMTDIAIARSIEFRFENTSCWTFKYEHYCPCGDVDGKGDNSDSYCNEKGGFSDNGDVCTGGKNGICPTTGQYYDKKYPHACKKYTGGQFLFASTADPKITEEGECSTPAPKPTDAP